MARARNRDAVLKTLRKALDEDRTKTFTAEISQLGLVEMTRQNVTEGVREIMTRPCPTCDGEGVIKSEETIAIEFERQLRELVADAGDERRRGVPRADEPARQRAVHRRRRARAARARGGDRASFFHFEGSEGLPLDHFAIVHGGHARRRSRSAPCPFREGDEVLVHIVEPHMYNVDDAVAKIDGYIDLGPGGGRYVGEKRLVRIEEAGPHRRPRRARRVAEEAAEATEERRKARERRQARRDRERATAPKPDAEASVPPGRRGRGTAAPPRPTRTRRSRAARGDREEAAEAARAPSAETRPSAESPTAGRTATTR